MEDQSSTPAKIPDEHKTTSEMPGPAKTPMTDEEREKLAAKLDADLESFMSGLEKRRYTEGWPEDRWQEEMEKHPFFMTKVPEEGEEVSPLIQGLQQLKYDENENTPSELAIAYKEDGNFNFKCKKYRFAILGYTEGLRKKCKDNEINAQLYNNRAAAHFLLKNWRSCIADCKAALLLKPVYPKAQIRLAQCYFKLKQLDNCLNCLDEILRRNKGDKEAEDLRSTVLAQKKIEERDKRKQDVHGNKRTKEEEALQKAIESRGIKQCGNREDVYPGASQTQVHLEDGRLVWPVLFLYPEVSTSDLVQEFHEDTTFGEQVNVMFEVFPLWDSELKYRPDRLRIYYDNKMAETIHRVEMDDRLGQVLPLKGFVVYGGIPTFIIVVAGSKTEAGLLNSYKSRLKEWRLEDPKKAEHKL